jgi:DNA-binding response OmpR family regulator
MYNILVCDDEKDIVGAIEVYLASDNYNVFKAYDGEQALKIIEGNDIHLVILDIMMPKLDGLLATVKSQLRRYTKLGSMEQKTGVFKTGGLELDDKLKEVTADGEAVKLTPIEYKIVRMLMENLGQVFSIEEIHDKVWNEPCYSVENTVAVHIRRIREKLEINPGEPKYLKVVWGIGYKIELNKAIFLSSVR